MFKKIMFSVIAFAIGVMVSLSIQACADDYDEISRSGSSNAYSAWCNDGIGSYTTYDEQGKVSAEIRNTFNHKGWLEKTIATYYYNGRKSGEQVTTYTYSSSGDTRYGIQVYTSFNESGQVSYTQQTTNEYRLHK